MAGVKFNRKIAIVQTTVASRVNATTLAALILARRLGACVQTAPIKSLYRWQGKTVSTNEFLLTVKTTSGLADRLADFIKKHHPYELPEITVTGAQAGPDYARWVAGETKGAMRTSG